MKRRNLWRRHDVANAEAPPRSTRPRFRSDNDLRLFRYACYSSAALTPLGLFSIAAFDLPFSYSPLALLPVPIMFALTYGIAWRHQKLGKRFSYYDDDQDG